VHASWRWRLWRRNTYRVVKLDAQHRQRAQNEANRADAAQLQTQEAELKLATLDKQLADALGQLHLFRERQGPTNVIASTELPPSSGVLNSSNPTFSPSIPSLVGVTPVLDVERHHRISNCQCGHSGLAPDGTGTIRCTGLIPAIALHS